MKIKKSIAHLVLIISLVVSLFSCSKYSAEEEKYIQEIQQQRKDIDNDFENDPDSPFNRDSNAVFHPLKYFDIDPGFVFKSKLFEYEQMDTISIYGTKGEERKVVKYGYVTINYDSHDYKINVYQGRARNGEEYYSIWFTDRTTNNESYGVGRYINFEKDEDPEHDYTIDFNLAYSPYCAYTPIYSCAIPTKEDYIDLAIEAGEKKFHD